MVAQRLHTENSAASTIQINMPSPSFSELFAQDKPLLVLAPMQDITGVDFLRIIHSYGGADLYFTEYFRVHRDSKPDKDILKSVDANPTGRPILAQMIGRDTSALVRTAMLLEKYPVAGIDFNLGCPAPIVCRKNAGGALLRDLPHVADIMHALRAALKTRLTLKTRIGYYSPEEWEKFLPFLKVLPLDAVTIHGRTVREGYSAPVHYDKIAEAVRELSCPVIANGEIRSADKAIEVWKSTGAAGIMVGRGAILNPWIFRQIRERLHGTAVFLPSFRDLYKYIERIYSETRIPGMGDKTHVSKIKKIAGFISCGLESRPSFHAQLMRAETPCDFFRACGDALSSDEPCFIP